ncbi:MAG: TonB-dependent receptor [Salinivirgaceae bacterium]
MQTLKFYFTLVFLASNFISFAQNGTVRGAVYDDATGETIPLVMIIAEGTTFGTTSDLDGKFNLSLPVGTYKLRVAFLSYESIIISDLVVNSGEVTVFDNLRLKESSTALSEVTISAKSVRNTESALLAMQKKSPNLMDGISSSALKKTGDSDAASSIKRITGVSVEGGKYVYVRGLGDRYTKTILNGMDIPGLDPDRNTLQMDIFPNNLIDNIIVYKSFSADLPADFTGGVVDIELKDFPEERKSEISVSGSYNNNYHFNSEYLSYEGGKTDFLGFDDGTRKIPATENIPFFAEVIGNPTGAKATRYKEILHDFNPTLAATQQTSFADYSFGISYGDQIQLKKITVGFNFALSYKNITEFYKDAKYSRFGLSGDASVYEMDVRELQTGNFGVNNALISGIAGFALKTKNSKYRFNLMHLQNGESKAGIFDFYNSDQGAVFNGIQHNLEYSQRSLTNLLVHGKHFIPASSWEINWKLAPTYSKIYDPDIRFTRYEDRNGSFNIGTESGFPERIWRELNEVNMAGVIHVKKDFDLMGLSSTLKFGGSHTYKQRDFIIQSYALNIRNIPLTGNPNELFAEENLWPYNGDVNKGTTFEANFMPTNPNQFKSNINNTGVYISTELALLKQLKTIIGLRAEKYVQQYTGQDQLGYKKLNNEKVLDDLDLFPTANIIYTLMEKQNLRFSFAKTIARPSFKELSYAEIFDPVSGRTFIGGLFHDANDVAGVEYWNGNLTKTDILNFDLRWEMFLEKEQMFSVSGFYKLLTNPIEMVQFATQTGSFQPRNVGNAEIMGLETEFRKNLSFIAPSLDVLQITANVSYSQSKIKLSKTEYDSRLTNARTGQIIDEYRQMAGQAPLLINAGFLFSGANNTIFEVFDAGLFYNMQSKTLIYVGIADRPDIYSTPFHSLNFTASQTMGKKKRTQVSFKVTNILNNDKETVFKAYEATDQIFDKLAQGATFGFGLKYSFF